MNHTKQNNMKRARRAHRSSMRITGTAERPRLAIYRTNRFMYAQLIDDTAHRTLAAAQSKGQASGVKSHGNKSEQALAVGEAIAKKAMEKKITTAVFDRRAYKFHGRVKNVAEGAKKGGLKI